MTAATRPHLPDLFDTEAAYLAMLLADALAGGPLRAAALRIAAEQPSVQRAIALRGEPASYPGCACCGGPA